MKDMSFKRRNPLQLDKHRNMRIKITRKLEYKRGKTMQEFIAYFITILSFAGIVTVILQHFMQCFETEAEQENDEVQNRRSEAAVGAELKQKRRNAANGNVRI